MEKENQNTENGLKSIAGRKKLLIIGFILLGIQLIATIVFIVILGKVKVIPFDYTIMIDIILVLLCIVFLIGQRWVIPGIITKIISLIMSIVLVVGSVYLGITYGAFKKTTGIDYKTTTVSIYVLKESGYKTIDELKDDTFGIMAELDREHTDEAVKEVETKMMQSIIKKEYPDAQALVAGLYNKEVRAIIMNESFINTIEAIKSYENFREETVKLTEYKKNEKIEKETGDDEKPTNEEVITFYISGIDLEGSPTENQNSDVNIIMVVNTKTEQIFLLNTPRDYYVPLSISNGIPDKLTHAGCFGIDVSVQTLANYYGINIDYYIKLNFTGFKSIIDALGGIDVYSEYEFTSTHGKDHFVVGMNHMNGKEALGFARERYSFPTGDNQRGKNQMAVINAIIKKLASSELLKNFTDVLNSISDCFVTDMTMEEIGDFVKIQLDRGISWDIVQYAVTGTGNNLAGYSYSIPNYVMIPDINYVTMAQTYLAQIYSNQKIVIQ